MWFLRGTNLEKLFVFVSKRNEADPKGLVSFLYRVSESCRKAPPEFRFAPSTLRNFVPPGAAHEAAAGHALSEPSGNYTADFIAGFSATSAIL